MIQEHTKEQRLQHYEAVSREASHNLNRSFQRDVIFQVIASTDTHPTAEEIFDEGRKIVPTLSLGTVYKNIALLKELGLIREVASTKGPVRYDGNLDKHHHFVCDVCQSMIDIPEDRQTAGLLGLAGLQEHRVTGLSVVFHGVCRSCQE